MEQNAADAMALLPMPEEAALTSPETLKALLRNKMAIKLEEITKISPNDILYEDEELLERRQAQDPALAHLIENIASLALSTEHPEVLENLMSSLSLYPKLEDFAKRMIEKRYAEELVKSKIGSTEAARPGVDVKCVVSPSDPNLVVPSYEPAANSFQRNDPVSYQPTVKQQAPESSQGFVRPVDPPNFKDMIAHYIGQKSVEGREHPASQIQLVSTKLPEMPSPNLSQTSPVAITKEKRAKKRSGSPVTSGGKGSRPKRGKYRNYDRENLIKAVQAVQSGEMSVHRAGSFYGVPHSTLEYKVKERHLNRAKKKDGTTTGTPGTTATAVKSVNLLSSRPTMVPTPSFTLDNPMLNRDFPQNNELTSTIDLTREESASVTTPNLEAFNIARIKLDALERNDDSDSPNSPHANPFNLWNSSSPLLPQFLPNPYERESFYASQMIRRFQEAASSRFLDNMQDHNNSLSPAPHRSEQESPIQGQSSGSCSPNLEKARSGVDTDTSATNCSVLDALLRGKSPLEAAAAAAINPSLPQPSADFNSNPWSVSSRLLNLSKRITEAQEEKTESPSNLSAINALCSLGLQTSLAAALHNQIPSSIDTSPQEPDAIEVADQHGQSPVPSGAHDNPEDAPQLLQDQDNITPINQITGNRSGEDMIEADQDIQQAD